MSNSMRLLGIIAVISFMLLGLLSVLEVIPTGSLPESAGKVLLAVGVLGGAILGIKLLSVGAKSNDSEKPPIL